MLHPSLFLLAYSGTPPDPQSFYSEIEAFSLGHFLGLAALRFWPTFLLALGCSAAALRSRQSTWLAMPLFLWAYESAADLLWLTGWPAGLAELLPRDSWVGSLALVVLVALLAGVAWFGRLEFRRREVAAFASALCAIVTVWIDQALLVFVVIPWPHVS